MESLPPILLPGDTVPPHLLPFTFASTSTSPSGPQPTLKLGPGLTTTGPQNQTTFFPSTSSSDPNNNDDNSTTIHPLHPGPLLTHPSNPTNPTLYLPLSLSPRYTPSPSDPLICTVLRSTSTHFLLSSSPHSPPLFLPHLSFESVSKKTRPQLPVGALVYCRVLSTSRHTDTEVMCVNPATGKAEGMGELKGGMVFRVSAGFAGRLLRRKQREEGGVGVLEELGERWGRAVGKDGKGKAKKEEQGEGFEVAVGRNGVVWVDVPNGGVKEVLAVGRCITETDEGGLGIEEQRKLVGRVLKELGRG